MTSSEENAMINEKINELDESLKEISSMMETPIANHNGELVKPANQNQAQTQTTNHDPNVIMKLREEHKKLFNFPTKPEDTRRLFVIIKTKMIDIKCTGCSSIH